MKEVTEYAQELQRKLAATDGAEAQLEAIKEFLEGVIADADERAYWVYAMNPS